jgi:hypothetical protein
LNGLGRPGAESLAELAACPALAELRLNVFANRIDDIGALGLRRLLDAPCLKRLWLVVLGCQLTDGCIHTGTVGRRQRRRGSDRPVPSF